MIEQHPPPCGRSFIDVRWSSRRALEAASPVQTLPGFAGGFRHAINYQPLGTAMVARSCRVC
jgi:uncharacterized protein YbcC (UPF0753/DUF2309 family)